MKKSTAYAAYTALYILSTGLSFIMFTFLGTGSISLASPLPGWGREGGLDIDPDAPRTEVCPLNGALYTVAEREVWEKRRPLAIMVENSTEARPHSGINLADVVYEAVAEGGVTRFLPVYLCGAAAADVIVAPVRSVRSYFIDWAAEYGETPLFGNVGGANCSAERLPNGAFGPCKTDPRAQAIEKMAELGWRHARGNNLDQFAVGAQAYIRNESRLGRRVATEHSVEASTEKLYRVGADRGWTNLNPQGVDWQESFRPWQFKEEPSEGGSVRRISYDFWQGYKQFDVRWQYNPETNTYLRFTGGEPHLDLETGEQLNATNVVVQKTTEIGPLGELKHMLYTTIGEGDALIFMGGEVIEGFWKKQNLTGRTIFTTKLGEEIEFNPGQVWISVVGTRANVSY